ncbi:MAG: hypothetical protein GTO02_18140 [Candidatus Dadabacteria bacterium]|nr:hypothetical protein [Candidatus Dadabacteria bacterium]
MEYLFDKDNAVVVFRDLGSVLQVRGENMINLPNIVRKESVVGFLPFLYWKGHIMFLFVWSTELSFIENIKINIYKTITII